MFEANTKFADWLEWFTAYYAIDDTMRVFALPSGKRAATDGKSCVIDLLPGPSSSPNTERGKRLADSIQGLLEMVEIKHERTMNFAEMGSAFGACEHPSVKTCRACDGKKIMPHDCGCDLCEADEEECGECGGAGRAFFTPDINPVECWGTCFDANRVAYMIEHAPKSETYTVRLCGDDRRRFDTLQIITPTWHGIIVDCTSIKNAREVMAIPANCS